MGIDDVDRMFRPRRVRLECERCSGTEDVQTTLEPPDGGSAPVLCRQCRAPEVDSLRMATDSLLGDLRREHEVGMDEIALWHAAPLAVGLCCEVCAARIDVRLVRTDEPAEGSVGPRCRPCSLTLLLDQARDETGV